MTADSGRPALTPAIWARVRIRPLTGFRRLPEIDDASRPMVVRALSPPAPLAATLPANAQTTLKMNISVAQNSHYGVAIDTFAREVEKRTDGRYKVQNFYSGALGAERESIEALQLGTLDLTMTSTGPVPNFVPDIAILDIPFLFRDYAQARARARRADRPGMLQKFEPKGIHGLAWGENGFRNMTNSKHPVIVPEDLKGLKMRTMENPVHIQAYRAFGIIPTPMAFTEVFTALQQGTVDGQENPLSVITAAKLDQVQKYLTLTGHVYSPAVILMSKAQWDKLSAADKQAFNDAAKEAVKANRARIDDDEKKAVADLRAKGMQVVEHRRQDEVPGGARADVRRVRQEVRSGQHRPHPQLQVNPVSRITESSGQREIGDGSSFPPTRSAKNNSDRISAIAEQARQPRRQRREQRQQRKHAELRPQEWPQLAHQPRQWHLGYDRRDEQQPANGRRDHPHRQVDDHDDAELQVVDAERVRDRREDRHQHDDARQRLDENAEHEQQQVHGEQECERRQVHADDPFGQVLRHA